MRARSGGPSPLGADGLTAAGLFLSVAAIYVLSGPGRMDSVDGQYRFEVARNLLEHGRPFLLDEGLVSRQLMTRGPDGTRYAVYSAGGSIAGLPLVALGLRGGPALARFLFSWTSGLLGGLIPAVLFAAWRGLGVGRRAAAGWALVAALATLSWPVAASCFEQAQQALFLLGATLCAWWAGRRDSLGWAAAGGLCGAALVNYQEAFFLLLPAAGLATLPARAARGALLRGALRRYTLSLVIALGLGAVAWMSWNQLRLGDPLDTGKWREGGEILGDPLVGVAALLVSPGKGVIFYSPVLLLCLAGLRGLLRRAPWLAVSAALSACLSLGLFGSLSFYGGDRCWGPRYMVPGMSLLALALPFAAPRGWRRWGAGVLIAAGLTAQLLGLSVDHHRFFHQRAVRPFFFVSDRGFYFRESALFSRPAEALDAWRPGVPDTVLRFHSSPRRDDPTYAQYPIWPPEQAPERMEQLAINYLPRPWPLWSGWLPGQLPVPAAPLAAALGGIALGGLGLIAAGVRR